MTSRNEPEDIRIATRKSTNDARQGVAPHTLRYMLGIGLAGVIVAFIIIYFVFV